MQPLLTPQQAAVLLAVMTRHLRDDTSAGLVRYVDVGMRNRETRRYQMADIEAYVGWPDGCLSGRSLPPIAPMRHGDGVPLTELGEASSRYAKLRGDIFNGLFPDHLVKLAPRDAGHLRLRAKTHFEVTRHRLMIEGVGPMLNHPPFFLALVIRRSLVALWARMKDDE